MNILLICPRFADLKTDSITDIPNHGAVLPIGFAYILAAIKQAGHKTDCINLNHEYGDVREITHNALKSKKYDYVCTGGLCIAYNELKKISDAVHTFPDSPGLIIGGGLITSEPELMFSALKPDYIVIGEGEETIEHLLSVLEEGGDVAGVQGIGYSNSNGDFVMPEPRPPISDLDSIAIPDLEGLGLEILLDSADAHDYDDVFDHPRALPIIGSRSCPFLCTFCFHPLGNKYRKRSVDSIITEIEHHVKKHRINIVVFNDDCFGHSKEYVLEICSRMKELRASLSWDLRWRCSFIVTKVDAELIETMKDAGAYAVCFGFESYSQTVLDSMKKRIKPEQIHNAIHICLDNDMPILAFFIFGDPAETLQTANETLEFWRKHYTAGIELGFIVPYPGSQIYIRCVEKGIIKDKLDFIENHQGDVLNFTDNMSESDFEKLRVKVYLTELTYRMYAIPSSCAKTENGKFNIVVKCPHCKKQNDYGNVIITTLSRLYHIRRICRHCRRRYWASSRLGFLLSRINCFVHRCVPDMFLVPFHKAMLRVKDIVYNLARF